MIKVKELWIYPVKSTTGYQVNTINYGPNGLDGDRRFLIVNAKGKFVTARQRPQLLNIRSHWIDENTVRLSTVNSQIDLTVPPTGQETSDVVVWADTVENVDLGEVAASWVSANLGEEARIVAVNEDCVRKSEKDHKAPISFADGYPLLVLSTASVAQINEHVSPPVTIQNFRPNIVLEGVEKGFDEDYMAIIKIGDVILDLVLGCARCVLTTVDPKTGQRRQDGQPMKALKKFRRGDDKQVYVGQNAVPRLEGIIEVGAEVVIIETRPHNIYACDL